MKNLLKLTAFLCLSVIIYSCSVESLDDATLTKVNNDTVVASVAQTCNNQNPQSRLVNNGTVPFTFKVIDSNDNTAEIQSIAPGTSSTFVSFGEGNTLFSVESNTSGITDSKVTLEMDLCTEVDIVINPSNILDAPIVQTID